MQSEMFEIDMRRLLYILILILSCMSVSDMSSYAHTQREFDLLYRKYKDQSMPELKEIGQQLLSRGSTDSAMVIYTIISNRYESDQKEEYKSYAAEARNSLGVINFLNANYAVAYSNFANAVELDGRRDAAGNLNISAIYLYFGDRKRAYDLLRAVFDEAIDKGHFYLASAALINLLTSDIDESVVPTDSIADIIGKYNQMVPETKNNPAWSLAAHMSRARLHEINGNNSGAIREYKLSLASSSSMLIPARNQFASYIGMGNAFLNSGMPDSAILYVKKAETIARDNGFAELIIRAYSDLSNIYKRAGDKKLADEYRFKKLELDDSLFNTKDFGKIRDLEMYHEVDKFERRISILQLEEKMRTRTIWILLAGLLLVIALGGYIFMQNHALRRKNRILYEKNMASMKAEEAARRDMMELIRKESELEKMRQAMPPSVADAESIGEEDASQRPEEGDMTGREDLPGNGSADEASVRKYAGPMLDDERCRALELRINEIMSDETVFCKEGFSLKELADRCGSNSKYVSQVLNDRMKTTFPQMLNERRISVARKRFVDFENYGHLTIEAIVADLGFRSRSTFSKTFKKITGLSPSEFQRMARTEK